MLHHLREKCSDGKEEVSKVGVKIPPFWPEKPEICFFQDAAQLSISGISTEEPKFNYLISQLKP